MSKRKLLALILSISLVIASVCAPSAILADEENDNGAPVNLEEPQEPQGNASSEEEEAPAAPAKEETPAAPAKEETPAAPAKEETPAAPAKDETPEKPSQNENPEQPGENENPEQPGENPDQPGENPDQPGENPDQPGENPDQPGENPDQPGENPDEPGENPDQPGENPDEPGENPDQPGENPDEPGENPDEPGENPDEPGENPDQPGENPDEPGEEPGEGSIKANDGDQKAIFENNEYKLGIGKTATITVTPSDFGLGIDDLQYDWEISQDSGATWELYERKVYSAEKPDDHPNVLKYKIPVPGADFSYKKTQIRCVVSGNGAEATTDPVVTFVRPYTVKVSAGTFAIGQSVTLTATAKGGNGTLKYLFQTSTDGVTWKDFGSESTSNKKTFTVKEAHLSMQYRCLVTDSKKIKVDSEPFTKIKKAFTVAVTSNPDPVKTGIGKKVVLTATPNGATGTITYQWWFSSNGTKWTKTTETGYNKNKLTIKSVKESYLNGYFRCLVSAGNGKIYSDPVQIKPAHNPRIYFLDGVNTAEEMKAGIGSDVALYADTDEGAITDCQWEFSMDGATWNPVTDAEGVADATYLSRLNVLVTDDIYKYKYRCLVTAADECPVYSKKTLQIEQPFTVSISPLTDGKIKAGVGEIVDLTATPSNGGAVTGWSWQASYDGGDWFELSTDQLFHYEVSEADYGMNRIRCLLTVGGETVNSAPAMIAKPYTVKVTADPASAGIANNVTLTADPDIDGDFTYVWQYSPDKGETWEDFEGQNDETMASPTWTYKVPRPQTGVFDYDTYRFRCKAATGEGVSQVVYSNAALIKRPFTVSAPKASPATVGVGTKVTLSLTTKNTKGTLSYVWQYSTDGGATWLNLSAAGSTMKKEKAVFTVAEEHFDAWFRCLVKDATLKKQTDSKILKGLKAAFTVAATPNERVVGIDEDAVFTAKPTGATGTIKYKWYYRVLGSGSGDESWKAATWTGKTNKTLTVGVTEAMMDSLYEFRCLVTAGNGKIYSNIVSIVKPHSPSVVVSPDTAGIGYPVRLTAETVPAPEAAGTASYRWEKRENGGEWNALDGNAAYLDITVPEFALHTEYRCLVTVNGHEVNSPEVSVISPFDVTVNPIKPGIGQTVVPTTVEDPLPIADCVWQQRADSTQDWTAYDPDYEIKETDYGKLQYRCLMTIGGETVDSEPVTVEKPFGLSITASVKAGINKTAAFKATVTDPEGDPDYLWQKSADTGATWVDLPDQTTSTFTYTFADADFNYDTYQFRCQVTANGKTLNSNVGKIVRPFTITMSANQKLDSGTATFTVKKPANASYLWQYSEDDGTTWNTCSKDTGYKTATLSVKINNTVFGRKYRCRVTVDTVQVTGPARYVEPAKVDDFAWAAGDDGFWQVTGYTGTATAVKIPAGRQGKKVTAIAKDAFKSNAAITSVTIPKAVETIGESAFEECGNLTKVVVSDFVTSIGKYAFKNCVKLSTMSISNK